MMGNLESQIHTIIADLDRARAHGTGYTYWNIQERLRNALHLASRKPEAAPSDTDEDARIAVLRERVATAKQELTDALNARHEALVAELDELRASQPVQVEVTEFPFEHKGVTIEEDGGGLWITQGGSNPHQWISPRARAALSAALGGGDHAE